MSEETKEIGKSGADKQEKVDSLREQHRELLERIKFQREGEEKEKKAENTTQAPASDKVDISAGAQALQNLQKLEELSKDPGISKILEQNNINLSQLYSQLDKNPAKAIEEINRALELIKKGMNTNQASGGGLPSDQKITDTGQTHETMEDKKLQ